MVRTRAVLGGIGAFKAVPDIVFIKDMRRQEIRLQATARWPPDARYADGRPGAVSGGGLP